jgi:hypothetical protein
MSWASFCSCRWDEGGNSLVDLRLARHEKIHDHINGTTPVDRGNLSQQLVTAQLLLLLATIAEGGPRFVRIAAATARQRIQRIVSMSGWRLSAAAAYHP